MMLTIMFAFNLMRYLRKLGGIGLLVLGILDGSLIPLPGSVDTLIVILATRHHDLWLYYAAMSTAGSVIGGLATYRLAMKGGEKVITKKLGKKRADRLSQLFTRWGFAAIAVPAILPPPFPTTAFLLVAGAMRYPAWRFTAALASGRAARFALVAYLAALYGRKALRQTAGHYQTVIVWSVVAIVAGTILLTIWWLYSTRTIKPKAAPAR
jgi:membrane protein YqaA with SNARE-associated domain